MRIVKLGASWCMPCKFLSKTLESIKDEEKYKDIELVELDVDEGEGHIMAQKMKISSVPTTFFYDDSGNLITRMTGNKPKTDILKIIDGMI